MGFPVSESLTGQDAAGRAANVPAAALLHNLAARLNALPRPSQLTRCNSLSTHDIPRFLYRAGGNTGRRALATILRMTGIGAPCIYYSGESAVTRATDPDGRRPFDRRRSHWQRAILVMARRLVAVRKAAPAPRTGSFVGLLADDGHNGLAYGRRQPGRRADVLNDDRRAYTYRVPVAAVEAAPGRRRRGSARRPLERRPARRHDHDRHERHGHPVAAGRY